MYPTIMSEFNFSPDTTTLLMFEPYGKFRIKEENHAFIYYIPDNVLNKTMVIQVLKEPGFIALLVRRFLKERAEYKRLWKQTGNKRYETISNNRKVKANGGVYGIQGSPSHPFGFAPMAIATTGIGRECAGLLINILNKLYPKSVIEWDTDGVYFSTEHFEEDKVLNIFNEKLGEKFKKDLDLTIDIDKYDAGYFYKAKNYLLKKGDKTIYHGAAMKARNKDNLSKNLIQELAEAKLEGKSIMDIMKKYQTLDFPLNDFAMSVTLGMPLYQYKNANALAPRLARMAEKELGIKPQPLNQYHYVKERDDYRLLEVASKPKLDKEYYLKEIERIMKMFDAAPIIESIDKWL
jgi:DNA polymerase elongation subunit (family B)